MITDADSPYDFNIMSICQEMRIKKFIKDAVSELSPVTPPLLYHLNGINLFVIINERKVNNTV